MKITTIPAYSYFTNDPKSYRTDVSIQSSSAFIERMLQTYPALAEERSVTVFTYNGEAIERDAYKKVNAAVNDDLLPYLGITYHSCYLYNYLPTDPEWKPIYEQCGQMLHTIGIKQNLFRIADNVPVSGDFLAAEKTVCLNNKELHFCGVGRYANNTKRGFNGSGYVPLGSATGNDFLIDAALTRVDIHGMVYPDGIFDSEGLAPYQEDKFGLRYVISFTWSGATAVDPPKLTRISVELSGWRGYNYNYLNQVFSDFETSLSGITEKDENPSDPYSQDGTSTTGGGDGFGGGSWLDSVDPASIPALPNINVCDLGLITMYNPTQAQVKALSDFLWSDTFDLNTYKKLFGNPMESVIGLAIVPVSPDLAGAKSVHMGNIDTEVSMSYLASNWKEIDCGWVDIEKFVGCFMDADPYTKISIYLPFIGIRSLSADDVNGGSIHVVFHVDVLTGACACFIEHSERGVLYTYNGSCITNVPLTSINFSGAIQNAVSAVISGIGVAAGMATGAAPVTAMGAAGLLNSAANAALNSKPQVQRSGNLGGSAGILSILTPYVIIERPDISMPSDMYKHIGNTCNMTYTLGAIEGFTMCEYVHIEGCPGTSEEIKEIEALLKEGVYL